MEFIIKITVTLLAGIMIWGIGVFVVKMWKSQIDPRKTVENCVAKLQPEPTKLLATREPDKFYQDGKPVGNIHETISELPNGFMFKIVSDTEELNIDRLIDFRRYQLKIVSMGYRTGMLGYSGKNGATSYKNAIINLQCKIVSE